MSDSDLDKAYDLLLVVIAIIYAIVGSFPEVFWAQPQYAPGLSLEIITMRMTALPLITFILLWFASILIPNKNGQVLLKFVAWMTTFSMFVVIIYTFMEGIKFIKIGKSHLANLLLVPMIFISPLIIYALIYPRYKEKYPDASFFRGKVWSVVSYVLYLLVLFANIYMTSTNYAAW